MKKYLLVIFALLSLTLLLLPFQSYAQMQKMPKGYNLEKFKKDAPKLLSSNNAGSEFWCSFIPCFELYSAGDKVYLYVSSSAKTTVTLEVPGKSYSVQKETIPNDIIAFALTPAIGQPYQKTDFTPPDTEKVYKGAGIHIYADQPIIVYGCTRFSYTSDSYLALPVYALGKEYIVASWPDVADDEYTGGPYLTSYTEVVAAYDNTIVKFTLGGTSTTKTMGGQLPRQTTSWTLYKGDVLIFGSLEPLADLTGSKWNATKPVSCFSGNYCGYVPENVGYCDFLMEAELPTYTWGKTYFYTPIAGRKKNSIIRIFAKDSNTTIYRDGQQIGFIKYPGGLKNEGWLSMKADNEAPRPIVFSGDKPIGITQYNCGQMDDSVVSDPFQMVLTPLEQFQKEITFNTPGIKGGKGFPTNWINIVYQTNDDGTMPDDLMLGQVQDSQFVSKSFNSFSPDSSMPFSIPVNGKHYACKQYLLPVEAVYKIKANNPFCVYAYGFSPYDSYGHPASVGLKNLEKPNDTLPPDPQFYENCMGTILNKDGINDAVVIDFPLNNDRTNLSTMRLISDSSYNYGFTFKDFISCQDSATTWRAWVLDLDKDARAFISFSDCVGNDTTIIINYTASKLTIRPDLDFGLLSAGDTVEKDVWLINESNTSSEYVDSVHLKYKNQGFEILNISLPQIVPPLDSFKFKVRFIATNAGEYLDTIGIGNTCLFSYKSQVKAKVGAARIDVSHYNFGDVAVNQPAQGSITIKNVGSVPLIITGFTHPRLSVFNDELRAITPQSPLVLNPGQGYNFLVDFLPTDFKSYIDTMFFTSNTERPIDNPPDSTAELNGRGINTDLIANSYDWGRKLINRPAFPSGPYDASPGDSIIILKNKGSQNITINSIRRTLDTNGNAFIFNEAALTYVVISPGSQLYVPVQFNPTVTGYHVLMLEYDNTAGSTTRTKLEGIGVVPRIKTVSVTFDSTLVMDTLHPSKKLGRFTNLSTAEWVYGDSILTITDFRVEPTGNEINTDLTGFGTQGFRFDKSLLKLPIVLKQGEYVEFEGQFAAPDIGKFYASLMSQSNAETEVLSLWIGYGVKLINVSDNNTVGETPILIFPNPVEDILTIQYNNTENLSLKIFDIYGNLIDELKNNVNQQNINYNTSKLGNGLYFIQLNTGEKIITKTFVVLR